MRSSRFLPLLAALLLAVSSLVLAACGGDSNGGSGASGSSQDARALLEETFTGKKTIDSGNLTLSLVVESAGGGSGAQNIDVKFEGPFQTKGDKQLPAFDFSFIASGGGQNISAGAVTDGTKGAVRYQGVDYAVDQGTFKQFKQGFEDAQSQSEQQGAGSLKELGVEPQNWLSNPTIEGEEEVGGAKTQLITSQVDLDAMLKDVNDLLGKATELGVPNTGQVPTELTPQQIAQVKKAVGKATVSVYTGTEDKTLRKMVISVDVKNPDAAGQTAKVDFTFAIAGLNEDQKIEIPGDLKPFSDLQEQLGGLGGLGALGGDGASGGGASGASPQVEKYTQCLQAAGSDVAAQQKCASLLGG